MLASKTPTARSEAAQRAKHIVRRLKALPAPARATELHRCVAHFTRVNRLGPERQIQVRTVEALARHAATSEVSDAGALTTIATEFEVLIGEQLEADVEAMLRVEMPRLIEAERRSDAIRSIRAAMQAAALLQLLELLVPRRILDEEVGDALELIDSMRRAAAPPWRIYLKAMTTMVWVLLHALAELKNGPRE